MYKKILEFRSSDTLIASGYELPIEVEKIVALADEKLAFSIRVQRPGASSYAAGNGFMSVTYPLNEGKYEGIDITNMPAISDAMAVEAEGLLDAAKGTAARDVEELIKWFDSGKKI